MGRFFFKNCQSYIGTKYKLGGDFFLLLVFFSRRALVVGLGGILFRIFSTKWSSKIRDIMRVMGGIVFFKIGYCVWLLVKGGYVMLLCARCVDRRW